MKFNDVHRMTSIDSLKLLMDGNQRFVSGLRSIESFLSAVKLREMAENGQSPFAIVLTCSDSRIPAEILFDRGIGDLFVIRVAGNIVAPSLIASIEFAVQSFATPLCVVMGHTQCGAIKAAIDYETNSKDHSLTPYLEKTVKKIVPAVRSARLSLSSKESHDPALFTNRVTTENVRRSASLISDRSSVIKKRVEEGKLLIVGGLYDLHTGLVEFDVPEQAASSEIPSFMSKTKLATRKAVSDPVN